jgi:uncharacterized protein YigE (DUF2233 family)
MKIFIKKIIKYFKIVHLIIFLVIFNNFAYGESDKLIWNSLAKDLQILRTPLYSPSFLSPELILIRTGLRYHKLKVVRATEFGSRTATVKELAKKSGATLMINGSFFDENGAPLGLVVTSGTSRQLLHNQGDTLTGILVYSGLGAQIKHRSEYEPASVLEAIQAGPRLIVNKLPTTTKGQDIRSRRSGVCIDAAQRLIIFAVDGWPFGASLKELQEFLIKPKIGCKEALNLDGGGSTQMYLRLNINSTPIIDLEGNDEIPVALGLFTK